MSLLRFGIRSRIYGGMGVLVLLGLSLAGRGIWQMTAIDQQVARMSTLSDNNVRALQIARLMEAMREASMRLKFTSQAGLDPGDRAEAQKTIEMLQATSSGNLSEQQRQAFQSMMAGCGTCHALRSDLGELSKQVEDNRGKLFNGGDQMTADTGRLVAAARQSGSDDIVTAARDVEAAILLAQVDNWRFLATRDPKGAATFKTNASAAMAELGKLEQLQLPDDVRQLVAPVRTSLSVYFGGFATVSSAMLKSDELFDNRMQPLIRQQMTLAMDIAASFGRDFVSAKDATAGMISGTVAMQELIAGIALLLGAVIAWLVGRSIIRPVAGMTSAMGKLAGGEIAVEIPSRDATDEIGAMAKAVEVFKQNAIERTRLEAEQKAQEERAKQEKQTALVGMAERIETETGTALESVGARTAAMAATAEEMSASARRTGASAQGAASAATQALANAQTVASAAEQLSASIREIAGQVSQSTEVVSRAVTAGSETRTTMEALNEKVGRIGAVADMIGEIAAKTNLLALNATIEAARAGDAGKGFAVVASEVKALATQTARSTEEISRHIAEVRSATGASVAAVGRIEQTINEIDAIAGSIAAAVEEQGAATAEIARNVTETAAAANEMTRLITEVSAEAEQTGQHTVEVLENTTALNTQVETLRRGVIQVVRTSAAEVDRRQHRRRPCLADATINCQGQSEKAVIRDISEYGCYAATPLQCQPGQRVELVLTRFGMRLQGSVIHSANDALRIAFAGDGLPAGDADRVSLETIPDVVRLTKDDHVAFVKKVLDAVEAREKLPPGSLATAHFCRLGRWYDGVSDPATLAMASFKAINEPHHAVHDSGRKALAALAANDMATVQREVAAMRAASGRVLQALDAFGREYPSTVEAERRVLPGGPSNSAAA